MVDNVFPGIYRLEIPLPGNPLKSVNSYVIMGRERNLIIDTAMNRPECRESLQEGIKALDLDMEKTDIFITHLHADHSGLCTWLATPQSTIYGSQEDTMAINMVLTDRVGSYWQEVAEFAYHNGFAEALRAVRHHPGIKFSLDKQVTRLNFSELSHGDILKVGDYRLVCLATPGHTQGHLCLYEENQRLLFSGDHILEDITPNIAMFSHAYNPLKDYITSLEKVAQLEVKLVLPGHRSLIHDHRSRISELLKHHQNRCQEILDIIAAAPGKQASAYHIASRMKWDLVYDNWEEVAPAQKWFATGESIAHLQYLYEQDKVKRYITGNQITYGLS